MAVRSARPSARVVVATPMSESATLGGRSGIDTGDGGGGGGRLRGAYANGFLESTGSGTAGTGSSWTGRTSGTDTPPDLDVRPAAAGAGLRAVSEPVMSRVTHRIGTAAAISTRYDRYLTPSGTTDDPRRRIEAPARPPSGTAHS